MEHSRNAEPRPIVRPVVLELIDPTGATTPVDAELRYDAREPYAATVAFITQSRTVHWMFGRDLLRTGLQEPSGDGDVHVWPCLDCDGHPVVIIELCSDDGDALIQARPGDVGGFVEDTFRAVEPGAESAHVDVDAAIAAILGLGAA